MASVQNAKAKVRTRLKQERLEMLDENHRLASVQIIEKLKTAVDWSRVKSVHYYEPIPELAEPDINGFITYLEDNYPNLELATSRQIENEWEIIGVHGGQPPEQFDIIIVPMLGFDPKTMHRIGYGGGYYDKFLSAQKSAQKIGICFSQGRVDDLPVQDHDVALDQIITD